jgi:hypothetical protein
VRKAPTHTPTRLRFRRRHQRICPLLSRASFSGELCYGTTQLRLVNAGRGQGRTSLAPRPYALPTPHILPPRTRQHSVETLPCGRLSTPPARPCTSRYSTGSTSSRSTRSTRRRYCLLPRAQPFGTGPGGSPYQRDARPLSHSRRRAAPGMPVDDGAIGTKNRVSRIDTPCPVAALLMKGPGALAITTTDRSIPLRLGLRPFRNLGVPFMPPSARRPRRYRTGVRVRRRFARAPPGPSRVGFASRPGRPDSPSVR